MAGNSRRKGAVRKQGTKKGQTVGSGGQRRKGLEGKGPTPPAEMRYGHPAQRKANARAAQRKDGGKGGAKSGSKPEGPEIIAGRNPVVEAVRADVPATALYVAVNIDNDDRVTEAVQRCADKGISILEIPRNELDQKAGGAVHHGVGLLVPPYSYSEPDALLTAARDEGEPPLLVALDGVTDPRNLGAVIRSAAAFGAHGVLLPQRRSAGMTAVAWRSSAGTAARLPVAVASNLTRQLRTYAEQGLMIVGLDADAETPLDDLNVATEPLVVVVGS